MRPLVFALLIVLVSCSGPSSEGTRPAGPVITTPHDPPKDLSLKFPAAGQVKMQIVSDHLFGKDFMPGGNLADYHTAAGDYQLFLLEAPDVRRAAYMLLDWKTAVPEAKYIAHMGGYSGTDNGKQFYIFAKGAYLAGVIGLPDEKADEEARKFAAML